VHYFDILVHNAWKNKDAIQHLTVMEFITHILNNLLRTPLSKFGDQDHEKSGKIKEVVMLPNGVPPRWAQQAGRSLRPGSN
jgi:hypothetical protein